MNGHIIMIIWIWKDTFSQAVTHRWNMEALFYGATIILKLVAHASLIIKSAVAAKFYMLQRNLHNTGENLSINGYFIAWNYRNTLVITLSWIFGIFVKL